MLCLYWSLHLRLQLPSRIQQYQYLDENLIWRITNVSLYFCKHLTPKQHGTNRSAPSMIAYSGLPGLGQPGSGKLRGWCGGMVLMIFVDLGIYCQNIPKKVWENPLLKIFGWWWWSVNEKITCNLCWKKLNIGTLGTWFEEQIEDPWMIGISHDPFGLDESNYSAGVCGGSRWFFIADVSAYWRIMPVN